MLVVGVLTTGSLYAHNHLEQTIPANGTKVSPAPQAIELEFEEETWLVSVAMTSAAGKPVMLEYIPSTALARHFSVPLPALDDGRYLVTWAVEGTDTHKLNGEFTFSIGTGE